MTITESSRHYLWNYLNKLSRAAKLWRFFPNLLRNGTLLFFYIADTVVPDYEIRLQHPEYTSHHLFFINLETTACCFLNFPIRKCTAWLLGISLFHFKNLVTGYSSLKTASYRGECQKTRKSASVLLCHRPLPPPLLSGSSLTPHHFCPTAVSCSFSFPKANGPSQEVTWTVLKLIEKNFF